MVRGVDEFVFSARGRLIWVMCSGRLHILTVEDWPRPEPFRWVTDNADDRLPLVIFPGPWSQWQRLGVEGEHGQVITVLRDDGTPVSRADDGPGRGADSGLREAAPMQFSSVFVPYWMLAASTAVLPLFCLARMLRASWIRRQRRAHCLCPGCGYNLTGNVSGTCPECGSVVVKGAEA